MYNSILYPENRIVYEKIKEKYFNAGETTVYNIKRLMRIACWIPKATNTRSDYVILIAFPLRQ